MSKRKIIKIDENKCNGCGLCIPNCPEGALQMIDGKARLLSDLFCDGLGACIGHCPEGAITIEEREAEKYDETRVMGNIIKQGKNVIKAHLVHLKEHNDKVHLKEAIGFLKKKGLDVPDLEGGVGEACKHSHANFECPGSKIVQFNESSEADDANAPKRVSQLRQWPVQITLVAPFAPYLQDADLLIAADCVPFAYADFHKDLLKGKVLLVGCPKLDDIEAYKIKITEILKNNNIKSITYAHMEVPCCSGLVNVIKTAISESGKKVPYNEIVISIRGERIK